MTTDSSLFTHHSSLHIFQVGAGSGGMPVLDMLCHDPRVMRVTLVEPDIYKPHNVERHLFAPSGIGESKAGLAELWLKERRPDLEILLLECDLLDSAEQGAFDEAIADADICICAADNEPAKYHFDALMRKHGKPWTLGEVLSGGIGGFVHWFVPGGPCYGCVASHLKRDIPVEQPTRAPDYSQPGGPVEETTVPASKAAIHAIASLHAVVTLQILNCRLQIEEGSPATFENLQSQIENHLGFNSLLLPLQRVPEVFDEPFRPYRFRIPRAADCLICQARPSPSSTEDLDVALDQALARLGDA
jgi:molybdopterin/thiamine biosynthesis adenylyltransferase